VSIRMYPIGGLIDGKPDFGGSEVLSAFEGLTAGDQYTYTLRLQVPKATRAQVRKRLVSLQKSGEDTRALLQLLEETDWEVSFLVDCY